MPHPRRSHRRPARRTRRPRAASSTRDGSLRARRCGRPRPRRRGPAATCGRTGRWRRRPSGSGRPASPGSARAPSRDRARARRGRSSGSAARGTRRARRRPRSGCASRRGAPGARPEPPSARAIARATTSRGASSPSGWASKTKRRPCSSISVAPSPRTASDTRNDVARRPAYRRVELEELEVGDVGSGADRRRDAVARRHLGVGRVRVQLAGAARGQHDRVGLERLAAAGAGIRLADEQLHPGDPSSARRRRRDLVEHAGRPGRRARSRVTSLARSPATSAFSIAVPVASPPACRIRGYECAASRPFTNPPAASRSKATPRAMSSRMRAGPSSTSTRTASGSLSPAPATRVSRTWSSTRSSSNMTPAIPPCA